MWWAVLAAVAGLLVYWVTVRIEQIVANARAWKEQGNPDVQSGGLTRFLVSVATIAAVFVVGCSLE